MRLWLLLAPVVCVLPIQPTVATQLASTKAPQNQPACPTSGDVRAEFASAVTSSSFRTPEGREVRLAGVIGPGEDGSPASPEVVAAARSTLAATLAGRELRLAVLNLADRYQRVTAQLFADGNWIQQTMLREGLVRVDPGRIAGLCERALYSAEREGIGAHTGHWADGRFRVKTPDEVTKSAGRFEIVEGEVWRSRDLRGREIIEFRNASSFEVAVQPQAARALRLTHVDLRRLRGKTIRVRGWIGLNDRPVMEISTAAALEVIQK